jgi:SAM-dependent methyltransferase
MPSHVDYRDSHTAPGKGASYDQNFCDKRYRKYIWSWEQNVLREILKTHLSDRDNIDYLDFACGTGRIVGFLENHVSASWGVDVSGEMLERARAKVKRTDLVHADLTKNSPLGNQKFDLITAFRFFLNAQRELREAAMSSLANHLKDGGILVFNSHMNHSSLTVKTLRTYRRLRGRDPDAITTFGYQDVDDVTRRSGLKIIDTFHRGLVPVFRDDTKIPMWSIHPIESLASKIPSMRNLSRFIIYVCALAP